MKKKDDQTNQMKFFISNSNIDSIKSSIDEGVDINLKDSNGSTFLHLSSELGKKEITELLISSGADVDARNKYGVTPFHYEVMNNRVKLVSILAIKRANIDAIDNRLLSKLYFCW